MNQGNGEWFSYALGALALWGLWGFFPKLATRTLDPRSATVFSSLGVVIVGFFLLWSLGFKPNYTHSGFAFAFLTGFTGSLGSYFFFKAVSRGPVASIICMTALYPVISLVLALVFIKEPVTLKQWAGVLLAIVSMTLVSI